MIFLFYWHTSDTITFTLGEWIKFTPKRWTIFAKDFPQDIILREQNLWPNCTFLSYNAGTPTAKLRSWTRSTIHGILVTRGRTAAWYSSTWSCTKLPFHARPNGFHIPPLFPPPLFEPYTNLIVSQTNTGCILPHFLWLWILHIWIERDISNNEMYSTVEGKDFQTQAYNYQSKISPASGFAGAIFLSLHSPFLPQGYWSSSEQSHN